MLRRRVLRKCWLKTAVFASVFFVIILVKIHKHTNDWKEGKTFFHDIDKENEKKMILLWNPRAWKKKTIDPVACGRCEFTTDKTMINSTNTGAVLFRSEQITQEEMPPLNTRRNDQLYIWTAGESAPALFHLRKIWLFWENKYGFNFTMSYRRDSSFYHPYGTSAEAYSSIRKRGYADNPGKLLKLKTKLAVAVVSNCNSTSGAQVRMQLLKNLLKAGLEADYFGDCFENQPLPKENRAEFENLLLKYKFYFAFENSYHCKDYITEKFYRNALYLGVVPVVWGTPKEDYKAVAPPGSFIHVEDFSSIHHLIQYLNYLNKNDTAYLEYFSWHSSKNINPKTFDRDYTYCVLCKVLHGINLTSGFKTEFSETGNNLFIRNVQSSPSPSLRSWFYNGNSRDCLRTRLRIVGNNTKIY